MPRVATIAVAAVVVGGAWAYKRHRDAGLDPGSIGAPPAPRERSPLWNFCPPAPKSLAAVCKAGQLVRALRDKIHGPPCGETNGVRARDLVGLYDAQNKSRNGKCAAVRHMLAMNPTSPFVRGANICTEAVVTPPTQGLGGLSAEERAKHEASGLCVLYESGCVPVRGARGWNKCHPDTYSLDPRSWDRVDPATHNGWPFWDGDKKTSARTCGSDEYGNHTNYVHGRSPSSTLCKQWKGLVS